MAETGQPAPNTSATQVDKDYLKTIPGILKIAEALASLATFICSVSVYWFSHYGGGWVSFVGIVCFMISSLHIVFYVLSLYQKVPPSVPIPIIEIIYYGVTCAAYLICVIITAVKAGWNGGIAAACVFSVICLGLYAADLIMTLLKVMGRTSTTTTTTTTTSSSTTYGGQDNIHAPQ